MYTYIRYHYVSYQKEKLIYANKIISIVFQLRLFKIVFVSLVNDIKFFNIFISTFLRQPISIYLISNFTNIYAT